MCLVIDANQAHAFGDLTNRPYISEIVKWIGQGGRIAAGGKLRDELFKIAAFRQLLTEWNRAGRIVNFDDALLAAEGERISDQCISDDPHVIALARLSGAKVVMTEDRALIADLKNNEVIGSRRKIYKQDSKGRQVTRAHKSLLAGSGCRP
jgi:hypothetical protein